MDHELEALIDQAGRDRVFDAALQAGWLSGHPVPKWVWRQIASDIIRETTEAGE